VEADTGLAPAATPPMAEANSFWLWLSLLLACGWGLSALYWWFAARRRAPLDARPDEHPSLRQARRELQQACTAADAAAARQALLAWGRALLAPRAIHNLHQLGAEFGPEFRREVEILNTSLYARSRESWQGTELLRLCQQLEQSHANNGAAPAQLMPLNPAG
jgi:hypothetical protein